MKAALLSIGDELALGQTQDTNARWLAGRLAERGVRCTQFRLVPDDLDAQRRALLELAADADLVLVTGGLGPTDDDLTRDALRLAMGDASPLVLDEPSLAALDRWFVARGRPMPAINRRQATRPSGATCLANDFGTAPGLQAAVGGATVICLPGPPREMEPMFARFVQPMLPRLAMATGAVHSFGQGESFLAERLGDRMRRERNPVVGTTASGSVVSARVRGTGEHASPEAMERELAEIEAIWRPYAFGRGAVTLAGALGEALRVAWPDDGARGKLHGRSRRVARDRGERLERLVPRRRDELRQRGQARPVRRLAGDAGGAWCGERAGRAGTRAWCAQGAACGLGGVDHRRRGPLRRQRGQARGHGVRRCPRSGLRTRAALPVSWRACERARPSREDRARARASGDRRARRRGGAVHLGVARGCLTAP